MRNRLLCLGTSATRVAAALAKASNQPLVLTHVLDFPARDRQAPNRRELVENAERQLETQAARLRQDHPEVSVHVAFGDLAELQAKNRECAPRTLR
ncbi:MAG TPA: universal stress protein [Polyangiales bacterium]|nr:universal stress protein [Polyangiales bacterium]